MTTEADAATDMYSRFKTAWDTYAPAIVGSMNAPKVEWPFVVEKSVPNPSLYWARVWKANDGSSQATMGRPAIFTTTGLVFIQIFCPVADKQAGSRGRALAEIARDAYRVPTVPNGVWYRDALIREMPAEPEWFSYRVSARYSFDELR